MAINDTAQLTVKGTVAGQTHVHTLHFRLMDPVLAEQDLINLWQANCRTEYRTLFVNVDEPCQTYRAAQVCGSIPLRAPVEEEEVAPNRVGVNAPSGDRLPSWLAAVSSVKTALAGRSRRGRYFIGGLYEVQAAGNDISTAHQAGVQAYGTKLIATFGAGGTEAGKFRLVVHSRTLAVPGVLCENSSTLVQAITAKLPMGSMKSRKPGSGT